MGIPPSNTRKTSIFGYQGVPSSYSSNRCPLSLLEFGRILGIREIYAPVKKLGR
jgi:hypothetical protein